jgi:uncharacterized protein (DUF697 family)
MVSMANPLTLARVWRILKEVDLDAIRRQAETPMRVLVVADTTSDADALAVLLAEGQSDPTPWLTSVDASLAARQLAAPSSAVAESADLVLVVTRVRDLASDLKSIRQAWLARRARIVTVAVGVGERHGRRQARGGITRVSVDALDGSAVEPIARAVLDAVASDQRLALARELPALRACVFDELISETARTNAGYAFSTGLAEVIPLLDIPLNIGDVLVLTKNQLVMGYKLALAAGKNGRPRDLVGEIVGVLGGGLIFRQIARQLIGLVPVIGIVPKVAVAYGGTWAIGRAVALWATEGRKVTGERLKELSREGLARGREMARSLRRTPAA